ncbi:MAG: DUF378 domain-containing protein [Candidatus Pacearchaeota archaeon]
MALLEKTALVLAAIGAINWGLAALSANAELIQYLQIDWLIKTVYIIVGLCGIYALIKAFK